jgi:hypothetical protein
VATSLHVGKAGQLAVMSEFSLKGYNVAIPEIDTGDDVFVVDDQKGAMWRIQVKTANATLQKKSRRFQFRSRESAIVTPVTPESTFIFVLRVDNLWRFLIVARNILHNYVVANSLGTLAGDYRQICVTLHNDGRAICSSVDLTHHLDDFSAWPSL